MLSWIREKFGTVVIGGIIGLIGVVFVFSGVFSPKRTQGMHSGTVAGTVNGESISLTEFNRELSRRVEFFKNMSGGKMTEDQIKAFRLREMVFQDLVRRKLVLQEAARQGLQAGNEQVMETIRSIPAFQKDGKFDVLTYKQVLQANQYTPGAFERMIRDDASERQWEEYFRRRAQVTVEEARRDYLESREKRKFKYVLLTAEAGRKTLTISDAEVQKFLSDPAKLNLAKAQFEGKKNGIYKGRDFDAVKPGIARELIAGDRVGEIRGANEKLAEQVLPLMGAEKAADGKVNAALKALGVEVKSSDWIQPQTQFIPNIGDASELVRDAFARKSPIDASQGGKAKKYSTAGGILVALVTDAEKADPSRFEAEKDKVLKQLAMRRGRELYSAFVSDLEKKARVEENAAVLGKED